MLTAEWSDQLLRFFRRLLDFYQKFLALEQKKYSILLSGKLEQLDGCMKTEQAFVLKARGLERKRQSLLTAAGADQHSFRELIGQTVPPRQAEMQEVYQKLAAVFAAVRRENKKCNTMAQIKLGYVSRVLSQVSHQSKMKQIYGKDLQPTGKPEGPFSRKV